MSVVRKQRWTSATRGAGGSSRPRKYGLKGCIPAVVSSTEGSCKEGTSEAEGTIRWPRSSKNERYVLRISSAFMRPSLGMRRSLGGMTQDVERPAESAGRSQSLRGCPLADDLGSAHGRSGKGLRLHLELHLLAFLQALQANGGERVALLLAHLDRGVCDRARACLAYAGLEHLDDVEDRAHVRPRLEDVSRLAVGLEREPERLTLVREGPRERQHPLAGLQRSDSTGHRLQLAGVIEEERRRTAGLARDVRQQLLRIGAVQAQADHVRLDLRVQVLRRRRGLTVGEEYPRGRSRVGRVRERESRVVVRAAVVGVDQRE